MNIKPPRKTTQKVIIKDLTLLIEKIQMKTPVYSPNNVQPLKSSPYTRHKKKKSNSFVLLKDPNYFNQYCFFKPFGRSPKNVGSPKELPKITKNSTIKSPSPRSKSPTNNVDFLRVSKKEIMLKAKK